MKKASASVEKVSARALEVSASMEKVSASALRVSAWTLSPPALARETVYAAIDAFGGLGPTACSAVGYNKV